ncbi:Proline iminopeptidase [Mycena sanguinolenta]|uniref:Proline iminopeptidase n=1 Tax=Mycena sanguinolenta TaxID=230812 RepID=A0A8H7DFV6_9AGAR|nr:Proline iminopeptidase [Mycena sanguinolenta]
MSAPTLAVTEGEAAFDVPAAGKPCKTWYKVVGTLGTRRPLIALHGGPLPCLYLANLAHMTKKYGIPLVFYDQIGTGNSTHLPEKMGDEEFWNDSLFLDELDNLLLHLGVQDEYDLIGHSWGGMLSARQASRQPAGLKKLILWSAPANMKTWVDTQVYLRTQLPQEVLDTLIAHDEGRADPAAYEKAHYIYRATYTCRVEPIPQVIFDALASVGSDPTVVVSLYGEHAGLKYEGSMRDWSMVEDAHKISVPTLLINGRYDLAQDAVMQPYFANIPRVKWVQFAESSHMAHMEERERFMDVVGSFLTD